MPLFFLISEILAAPKLFQPLRASFSKTGGLFLLYALWAAIMLVKIALAMARDGLPYPDRGAPSQRAALPAFACLALLHKPIEAATIPTFPPPLMPLILGSCALNLVWFYLGTLTADRWLARPAPPSGAQTGMPGYPRA